ISVGPERRDGDAVEIEQFLPDIDVARYRVAGVNGCQAVSTCVRWPDDVGGAEVRGGDGRRGRVTGETGPDRNAARQRRDTGELPPVEHTARDGITHLTACAVGQERVPRGIQDVAAVTVEHAIG